jgi:hopene-associated glycosyltransferase HpnB
VSGIVLTAAGAAIWLIILLLPWRPWSTRETLDATPGEPAPDLSDLTVLIPARNEAEVIGEVLSALDTQGSNLRVVVIDDQSDDGTAEAARAASPNDLEIVDGSPLPDGWSGKLWALEQGRKHANTALLLLLDADIRLDPGSIAALLRQRDETGAAFVSLMARLRMVSGWEILLMPAFVYFFKLLYPFALSNAARGAIAAGAGGCILVETQALEKIGGFGAIQGALIDDCALARAIKQGGQRTWIGMTHSAVSLRPYRVLGDIWDMVARNAFTQLRYSPVLLLVVSVIFVLACGMPLLALVAFPGVIVKLLGGLGFAAMIASYIPTLRYYGLSPLLAVAMPAIGALYLVMTWSSAFRYWRGRRSQWKGRVYRRQTP